MKGMSRLLIVAVVSIGIAFCLSWLPKLDSKSRLNAQEASAFGSSSAAKQLNDQNLVDLLMKQPLFMDIGHVEWSDSILSIDLKTKQGQADADFIYRDLYTLSRLGFNGTKNVSQLLVRIMELPTNPNSQSQLLVAMEARREDTKKTDLNLTQPGIINAEQYVSSHFRLTFTPRWLDRQSH
ncbi:MAG: hypothetical protein K0R67_1376 [Paenibacillus sp.]|nr:hypothetical protein [Paenibacillus sp.]